MEATIQVLRELLVEAGVDRAVAEAVLPDVPMLRQGVDSLDYPAFSLAVESRFGLSIDERASLFSILSNAGLKSGNCDETIEAKIPTTEIKHRVGNTTINWFYF